MARVQHVGAQNYWDSHHAGHTLPWDVGVEDCRMEGNQEYALCVCVPSALFSFLYCDRRRAHSKPPSSINLEHCLGPQDQENTSVLRLLHLDGRHFCDYVWPLFLSKERQAPIQGAIGNLSFDSDSFYFWISRGISLLFTKI